MNQKFRDLVASLEPKYRALLEMEPVRFGSLPKEIPERGIYVFSEGGQHLYVGRTNGIRRRLRIAARRFRRGCTRMSITSPSSSTARHKYCVRPCIRTNSSSRYHVSPWRPRRSRRAYSSRQAPLADRLVRDVDAALGEEVLDVPKTEAEPVVQPHRVTDASDGNRGVGALIQAEQSGMLTIVPPAGHDLDVKSRVHPKYVSRRELIRPSPRAARRVGEPDAIPRGQRGVEAERATPVLRSRKPP